MEYNIVEKIGIINRIESLILKPGLMVSLILSIALFVNLSNRVYSIEIKGDYPAIEKSILAFFNENGVYTFSYNISGKRLKEIEFLMKEKFNDELEFLEIVKDGAVISLSYKKRRKELLIEDEKGSLYASKDGVIRKFSLLSGVKNVKLYDFVKKGDLLVSDIIVTTDNKNIVISSVGKVFASTFYYVEVRSEIEMDVASKHAYLLDLARKKVGENLNSEDEYIESENILINDLNKGYMKIYYVLYEDITI